MHDLIIVGAGAAGCSAAVTARLRNLDVLMIYAGEGSLEKARQVDNYLGLPGISGKELLTRFRGHAQELGAVMLRQLAQKVLPAGNAFSVLAGNEVYEAKTVLLACGAARVSLLKGEEELLGAGVSYCATCDGMFFRGKRIAVVAGSEEAVEEAAFLSELGQVTYYSEKPHDRTGLPSAVRVSDEKPVGMKREGGTLTLLTSGGERETDGIFILRPAVSLSQLLPGLETEKGAVKTDAALMTGIPGVFAAGDMVGLPWQAAKAAGDGNRAALSVASYLRSASAGRTGVRGREEE